MRRRRFVASMGAGVGASFLPSFAPPALASLPPGAAPGLIQLNSNENPYGPSTRALAAFSGSAPAAARYPDAAQEALIDSIARHHGVDRGEIVLGCGSSEVLQVAAMAFLGAGRKVVAAEPTFEAVLGYARVTRAEAVTVPLTTDFRHDLPAMATACDGSPASCTCAIPTIPRERSSAATRCPPS